MGKDKKENKEIVFSKKQLITSKKFMNERDILTVLVKDDETISNDEAVRRIENFKKGKVN